MDLQLKNRVAVIMGSSKGIGLAIAKSFLQEGTKVAICARNKKQLQEAAEELQTIGTVFWQVVDATLEEDVYAFAQAVQNHYGRIDCWVNNIGASRLRDGNDYTGEDIDWAVRVCFNSAVYGCQAAARHMKPAGGGAIVNISSLAARCGTAGRSTLYGPLKAAVASLAVTFAAELAAWNIRVNAVLPGFTLTPKVKETISLTELAANKARTLLGRAAEPEEIAAPVVFLCSDKASYITGASLEVSGGTSVVLNTAYSYERKEKEETIVEAEFL